MLISFFPISCDVLLNTQISLLFILKKSDILGNCEYVAILDDIVRESIQKKCFIFFKLQKKKMRKY